MSQQTVDVVIIGAGPVGLMCAYLGRLCGLRIVIIDKSAEPLNVGRADALNARTLQLLEIVSLFSALYPLGKTCNTSSVWAGGAFISRQSTWWDELEGCSHKHFLMLGQAHIEQHLDNILKVADAAVRRSTSIENIELNDDGCLTTLSTGETIQSRYVIGADGSRSFVRQHFNISFNIVRPEITWAVIDGVIDTDFTKVPEIIVFQAETSDVAWIPREGDIDRFYVRMDTKHFTLDDAIQKINHAMKPHALHFKKIEWFSQFSVKESVAEKFFIHDRIFLAGDACHIHSVNGGQGLNTGLADAFNLMWKLHRVLKQNAPCTLLQRYEHERKPIAERVITTSGELVRATKYSETGTHAQDYVEIVKRHAGNITGMGIRYGADGLVGTRLFDFNVYYGVPQDSMIDDGLPRPLRSLAMTNESNQLAMTNASNSLEHKRVYSLLDYSKFTLLIFIDIDVNLDVPEFVNAIQIYSAAHSKKYWTDNCEYLNKAILVRPDSYIELIVPVNNISATLAAHFNLNVTRQCQQPTFFQEQASE